MVCGAEPHAAMGQATGAVAAPHDEPADTAHTYRSRTAALFDVRLALTPSPAVAPERAVAVAFRNGPAAGPALPDALAGGERLAAHHPYHAARAELLHRLGRRPGAADAHRRAPDLAGTPSERGHLRRRLAEVAP
ncbi:hypothetical protein C6N75_19515 [Streptomyces solincola]|uniref:Uncharacterized protein n=1 Tax=Streptomyces solincola TaxID=2100817 RepID=A0A2S9PTA1_9ACTN|nr:hypothetical protein [Streptomyces solincola]PRH77567.1 hypothetical protein C6N75_19515 [Streptomyces solincola]